LSQDEVADHPQVRANESLVERQLPFQGRVQEGADAIVLNQLNAPAVLGELELLTSRKRTASVRAVDSARLLGLDHEKIEERVEAGDVVVLQTLYGISKVVAMRLVLLSE
jgi:CRP-like cAMP-binding protein